MAKKKTANLDPDAPLLHPDHPRPVTRRDFLRQGFISGTGMVLGGGIFSLFANPRAAQAALSADIQTLAANAGCPVNTFTGGKIPFIAFDLAGGANIAGSNVLVGGMGGQLDLLSTQGYSKLGLPGDMLPGQPEATPTPTSNRDYTDSSFGLVFHSDSAFLRGMLEKTQAGTRANVDGAIIPARSGNDTNTNPHNPMYGIARAGAAGEVVTLIGSRATDSGGNSIAPAMLMDPEIRPTKVDRPSDVTGMVDTGNLTGILGPDDVVPVMESIARISDQKLRLGTINTGITRDDVIKDLVRCGYIGAADIADRFAGVDIDPAGDTDIVGPTGIFSQTEFDNDREFRKTASVMKMVIDGYAGAGTIAMGGYDYHTGNRAVGEIRDLRAGRCIGACLEYAARRGVPLMIYVFSDGSLSSNGTIDDSVDGRGKGVWTGDNSSVAASFFLVYSPTAKPAPLIPGRQIGYFNSGASVVTSSSPAANNVNLLVNTVIANYMSLNGDLGQFGTLFPNNGLGNVDNLVAFGNII